MENYLITCSNGDVYSIPVDIIARHRATFYANAYPDEFEDFAAALKSTIELFEDKDAISDWARNNMRWSDVQECAMLIDSRHKRLDMEKEWTNPEEITIK